MENLCFTIARSIFNDMKRSGCLVVWSLSMSRDKRRGYCRASARNDACSRWDSQRVVSQGMGAPSNSSRGDQGAAPSYVQPHLGCLWTLSSCIQALCLFSAIWPSEGRPHPPPVHRLAFSTSSLEWVIVRGQWEEEEGWQELAPQGHPWRISLCSCWT